jgi:hypothetical protein
MIERTVETNIDRIFPNTDSDLLSVIITERYNDDSTKEYDMNIVIRAEGIHSENIENMDNFEEFLGTQLAVFLGELIIKINPEMKDKLTKIKEKNKKDPHLREIIEKIEKIQEIYPETGDDKNDNCNNIGEEKKTTV